MLCNKNGTKAVCNTYYTQLINIENIWTFLKSTKKKITTIKMSIIHEFTFFSKRVSSYIRMKVIINLNYIEGSEIMNRVRYYFSTSILAKIGKYCRSVRM